MANAGAARLALIFAGLIFLTACEEGSNPFKEGLFQKKDATGEAVADDAAQAQANGSVVEKDVEAPEVFQQVEAALWDGRPSLGGVWVAHPDVPEPERVIIRNEDNGKFVIGALFRRERENPGPRIQVSSDAAAELGMLAGSPAELSVTALRREVVEVPAPEVLPVTDAIESPEAIKETTLDPVATLAASAIEQATAPAKDASAKPVITPAEVTAAATPAAAPAAAPAATSKLDKPFVQIGIFSIQANANNTGDMLRNAGVVPTIKESTSNGKTYWRVIVGPAQTSAERSEILKKVKGLGFGDAYAVSR